MFEAVSTLVDEHAELERQLSQPETHADARLARAPGIHCHVDVLVF